MKYGLVIVLTILIMIIILEISQSANQLCDVGHHLKEVTELDQELDNIINEDRE